MKSTSFIKIYVVLCMLIFVHEDMNVIAAPKKYPAVVDVRTEYKRNPVGIENDRPRLFWKLQSTQNNIMQKSYQIRAALSESDLIKNQNLLWNSGTVLSDQSVQVAYKGQPLKSSQRVYWQVKVWDNQGGVSKWSDIAFFEMGLLNKTDWQAKWIEPAWREDENKPYPSPYLRKETTLSKDIASARLYITCHGLYEAFINGKKVGDELFTPGWTSYHNRLQYQVYDVTSMLKRGENAFGVILGDGWYRGPLVWQGKKNLYGKKSALLYQLKVTYKDGTSESILSDEYWKASTCAIQKSEIYDGETYDATLEQSGWAMPGFDEKGWTNCKDRGADYDALTASCGEAVKVTEELKPIEKIITPKGELVFDFGQNLVGWVHFRLRGNKGDRIILNHAEVLDQEGNFYTANLRVAKAQDEYVFKGEGVEEFEPHFTFHGFRYVKISGYKGEVNTGDLTAKVIHSDMEATGDFTCSDTLVNRLQKNIQWGLRGNFLDVPTDCPQRDERLGWTGDAQVFASTACYNRNTANFYTKWMKDFTTDQKSDGSVPWVVPNVVENGGGTGWSDGFGATGWADAAVIIPWTVYQAYGDTSILKAQYASMKGWEEYMILHAGDRYIFDYGFHFGDWLAFAEYMSYKYNAPDYGYAGANTKKDLIATAYFYYTTGLMEKIARVLGNMEDAEKYKSIRPKIKEAFAREFVTQSGCLSSDTQTAYILALSFGIMPDDMRDIAAKRLADDVTHFGHLTTGFLGTPLICQALSDNDYPELAYMLLLNKRYPSWLYPVTKGATTIWERWDCIKPDGSFQDAGMNSFNHYAYGAVGEWLYSRVAGIQMDEDKPGYKHFIIKPLLTDSINDVKASYESMYGPIKSEWKVNDTTVNYKVVIPANTTATVYVSAKSPDDVTIQDTSIQKYKADYEWLKDENLVKLELGSGSYSLRSVK